MYKGEAKALNVQFLSDSEYFGAVELSGVIW